ncbi:hypothetical protein WG219_00715 [Ectopseudomonas mendocina]|uniref:Flagellar hook-associated protein 2 C-terminal domain-containing protein n=1 Tax=Ectopseudomonas mendocina TaxID=300 RepID=A0ABZ2RGZ4_ECTME
MVIKVDKQLPAAGAIAPQTRRTPVALPPRSNRAHAASAPQVQPQSNSKSASFSLQLNQQLTSMQAADNYLGDLQARLGQLKLRLSRDLGNSQSSPAAREELEAEMQAVRELLAERSQRSAQSLDSRLRLSLNEPVRSRFTLQGFDSIEQVQQAGKETLLFSAGRKLAEPLAVVLDEGLTEQQILRRFNNGLSPAGIRAELDAGGELKFSARESDWYAIKDELRVQGEGKLAEKTAAYVASEEDQLLRLPAATQLDGARDLRRVLDQVVTSLDRITALREQLAQRQDEVREFLARHTDENEQQWASAFAGEVFHLLRGNNYGASAQTVVAQSTISRYTVVSLLS